MKQKVFICSEYYKPGFLGGGPIQSVFNLTNLLSNNFQFFVLTKNFDLNQKLNPYNLKINKWITQNNNSQIRYVNSFRYYFFTWIQLFIIKPNFIYLNSFFSVGTRTNLFQAMFYSFFYNCKIILAPRGEFDNGALSIKSIKKYLFINFFNIISNSKIIFQATTKKEKELIEKQIKNKQIITANNIPKLVQLKRDKTNKNPLISKFVFISRISPKKNLLFAIECLKEARVKGSIEFIIIGPFEDKDYWNKCKHELKKLPENICVNVLGPIPNHKIDPFLRSCHYLFFPTLGENFGHVIYESLANGLPIVISEHTPWEEGFKNGVFALPLANKAAFVSIISKLHEFNQDEYDEISCNALSYARKKINLEDLKKQYINLFK